METYRRAASSAWPSNQSMGVIFCVSVGMEPPEVAARELFHGRPRDRHPEGPADACVTRAQRRPVLEPEDGVTQLAWPWLRSAAFPRGAPSQPSGAPTSTEIHGQWRRPPAHSCSAPEMATGTTGAPLWAARKATPERKATGSSCR